MSEKQSKLPLVALFAAVAGLAAYATVPRKVDLNVITKGVVSDAKGKIVERYIGTDKGRIPLKDTSGFEIAIPPRTPQKAICLWSQDWTLHGHIHDCKPQ